MTISCLLGRDVHLVLVIIGTPMLRMLRRFQLMILMTIPRRYHSSSEDPDDPDHADDDPDHADDVFQDIYRTRIPRIEDLNYEDWQRMNRNFPFQLFY